MSGILYIVATPIGNLEDISPRAIATLGEVDLVAVEDTRHSATLLRHYDIQTPVTSLHEHNEESVCARLVRRLENGERVALISDAGTPLLSDPGYRLVRFAAEHGIRVSPIPGPSAVTAALSAAGLPTDRFVFEGFLPPKQAARTDRLKQMDTESRTLVFFESPHRIVACLDDMKAVFGGGRPAAVCRELTKRFETILRGDLAGVCDRVSNDPEQRKGEFVVVIAGFVGKVEPGLAEALSTARVLLDFLPPSQAARAASRLHDIPRRKIFDELTAER